MHEVRPPWLHIFNFDVAFHIVGRRVCNNFAIFVTHLDGNALVGLRLIAHDLVEYSAAAVHNVGRRYHVGDVLRGCRVQHHRSMDAGIIEEVKCIRLHNGRAVVTAKSSIKGMIDSGVSMQPIWEFLHGQLDNFALRNGGLHQGVVA